MKLRLFSFLILIFFLLFDTNLIAETRCEKFYNQIRQSEISSELYRYPRIYQKTVGFGVAYAWDATADDNYGDWIIDFDKNGYPKVGKLLTQDIIEKNVKVGDVILEVNGEDIRNYKIDTGVFFSDLFEKDENVFKLKNHSGNNYEIKTKKIERNPVDYTYDVYFSHIDINDKNGSFDVTMKKDFVGSLDEDTLLFKYAKENLLYKINDEFYYEECNYDVNKWRILENVQPDYGINFPQVITNDKTLQKEYYFIQPLFKELSPSYEESSLQISYKFEGTKTIRNNFNLRSFPFDKQTLSVYLYQTRYEIEEHDLAPTDWSQRNTERFLAQRDPIQGWNIIDFKMNFKPHKDPNYDSWSDGVEFNFIVERKSSYYVYKVIFPIILILMICWSAVWIDPKEIESRLTITIVCLLSLIAYNFVIDSELPKLEYLTIMDYIILISYVYAAIPNFLSIYSFKLIKTNKTLAEKYESYEKRFGLPSYILIIFFIIILSASDAPEHTNAFFSWAAMR